MIIQMNGSDMYVAVNNQQIVVQKVVANADYQKGIC